MSQNWSILNSCLIIKLSKNSDNLSFIEPLFNEGCKHLILDLSEVLDINEFYLTKFAKFGKNLVNTNSFVMISNQCHYDDFLIVPTLQEAFDIIELEDIERSLNI
jgi:hypothetical protein